MGEHKRQLCPCGSGRHRNACCRAFPRGTRLELEQSALRLSRAGRHAEACEYLAERAALNPENPLIWNDLGNEYAAAGDFDKAIEALQRAHAADPGHALPLYNLGAHSLNRARELPAGSEGAAGMIEAAIRYFSASLERDAERADCHRSLAVACSLLRYDARAAFHAAEAHRLDSRLEP